MIRTWSSLSVGSTFGSKSSKSSKASSAKDISAMISCNNELRDILTFEDPDLLRATDLSEVTACAGRAFRRPDGESEADLFDKTQSVEQIHTFISHNWATARWHKYLAVTLHFNLNGGLMVALGFIAAGIAWHQASGAKSWHGFLHLVTTPAMVIAVFLGRRVLAYCGCRGPTIFLDVCCIHQTDKALQRKGIEKLGAFMHRSDNLLVCYSDLYLKRMWTVFEVCTFMVVNEVQRLSMVPLLLPTIALLLGGISYFTGVLLLFVAHRYYDSTQEVLYENIHWVALQVLLLTMVSMFMFVLPARRYFLHLSDMLAEVRDFDVRTADCACEADRQYTVAAIVQLMRHLDVEREGEVNSETLLNDFNEFVRNQVPNVIRQSTGPFGMPLKHIIMLCCVPQLTLHLEFFTHFKEADSLLLIMLRCISTCCFSMMVVSHFSSSFAHLKGARNAAYILFVCWFCSTLFLYLVYDWEWFLVSQHSQNETLINVMEWYVWIRPVLLSLATLLLVRWRREEGAEIKLVPEPELDSWTL